SKSKTKRINLIQSGLTRINRQARSPVRKVVNFVGRGLSKLKFWAKGTDNHPGGPAVIGEKGRELGNLHNGRWFVSPGRDTLVDLQKGSQVISKLKHERMLRGVNK